MLCGITIALSNTAYAQGTADTYPTKPVQIIVPFTPGGATDIEARVYAQKLTESVGRPFIVDYKAGAGGTIGGAYVAKSVADGHTLLVVTSSFTVNPAFYKELPYDTVKDFAPVSLMSKRVTVLLARPSFPAATIRDYIAYAKASPGKINIGATGAGSIPHLAGAWLHNASNTQATYIQYKGTTPLLLDLIAERVDVNPSPLVNGLQYIKTGKLKILGIMSDDRSDLLPGVQTVAEQGVPGFDYSSWLGFVAPRSTPTAIVNKLSTEFARAARAPDVAQKFGPEGTTMVGSTPAKVQELIVTEVNRWSKLVQASGIKLDE